MGGVDSIVGYQEFYINKFDLCRRKIELTTETQIKFVGYYDIKV